jgi:hypothetical protein
MAGEIKYNIELLNNFCKENNLNILENFENTKVNCNVKLTSKCINKDCNEFFNKKFHILYKTKVFTCKNCTSNQRLKNYKETIMNKYGVEHISKLQEIKNKKILTCLNKYGVQNVAQNIDIINKTKNTKKIKYIEQNKTLPPSLIDKKQELFEKYGTHNFRNSDYIKNKIKQTVLEKYGVDHISKSKEIQAIKRKNCMNKYGVEFSTQHPEFAEKAGKNCYSIKEYTLPSGKIIKVQGYEPFALRDIINDEKINESDIITGCKNVPTIWYDDLEGNKHRHFVDIFISSQNKCIEIKSSWTVKKENVFLKQKAGKELGYNYEIWVYNEKGLIINKFI